MLITPRLLLSVGFVMAVGWALIRRSRAKIESVTIAVATIWELDHRCRAIGYLLIETPGLRRVEIHLGDLFIADPSTVSLLTYTQRQLEDADVILSIVAAPAVSRFLLARGLPASTKEAKDELAPRIAFPN